MLLGRPAVYVRGERAARHCQVLVGWGNKPSGVRARALAARLGVPALSLEDGFLRSVGGSADASAFSLCVDDLGIYYDASRESRLERQIARPLAPDEVRRAQALITGWRQARVSKYNGIRDTTVEPERQWVIVADQTAGDQSVIGAGASAGSCRQMLEAAIDAHPDADILVKAHPDVVAGRKRGYLEDLRGRYAGRIQLLSTPLHAPDVLEHAAAVYTVSSQLGFEALIWGVPVHTFGMPFYAGWGLTADHGAAAPPRRRSVTLAQLVHAALVDYAVYVDPETGLPCNVERVMEHIRLQRAMRARFAPHVHALGFSRRKRPILRRYFNGSEVTFGKPGRPVPASAGAVAIWGNRAVPPNAGHLQAIRVEDGFLRSAGLGAALVPPLSWVQDPRGIYYDATRPCALTDLLASSEFPPALLERASALRREVVARAISKYNLVSRADWKRPQTRKVVILVVGQVESDASLVYGSAPERPVRTNAALIEAVADAHPLAWILYRAHPDVANGYRSARGLPDHVERLVDETVDHASLDTLLSQVDAVHVMTSLTGFEALLRGVPVTTHGMPFYAGWGLTTDLAQGLRRPRQLTLDELVAGTLILYPTYVSGVSGQFTTPEQILRELESARASAAQGGQRGWAPRFLNRLFHSLSAMSGKDASAGDAG
ncbi:capsular biosynthesis protein [Cupriavidus sp. SK-4]|uniref:capsular polysaccharide biosynthesis protein n=1 Tax=Cupriavidus sp. SK-4 TaxID=574750 RepID=UPI00044E7583|nr:capsular polysaccharide biosynthesis protein [Cupriavidus sp. SK-4]EYS97086.1 capsular biosynthesis protein [Cupriavidus sp. SK-4]